MLIKLKGRKTKELSIRGIKGDFNVRAGCLIPVYIDLGDTYETMWMLCDTVTHNISADNHTMDITFVDTKVKE